MAKSTEDGQNSAGARQTRVFGAIAFGCALMAVAPLAGAVDGGSTPDFPHVQASAAATPAATGGAAAPTHAAVAAAPAPAGSGQHHPGVPAKLLFAAAKTPAPMATRAIGFYSRGCLAGAQPLPVDGPQWQAMRLSRNRFWGTPALVSFIERFADDARRYDGWHGLLVGDMSQPRGGPMQSSHASHQIGLDVDIWYDPMPQRRYAKADREAISATEFVLPNHLEVDPKKWTEAHERLLRRAASFGEVERIFVHPAIKKALCQHSATDVDRSWLYKIRPLWGHDDHFHVRIKCPDGMAGCKQQAPTQADDGCGKELTNWLALVSRPPAPPPPAGSPPPKEITLDGLPAECAAVLDMPAAVAKK